MPLMPTSKSTVGRYQSVQLPLAEHSLSSQLALFRQGSPAKQDCLLACPWPPSGPSLEVPASFRELREHRVRCRCRWRLRDRFRKFRTKIRSHFLESDAGKSVFRFRSWSSTNGGRSYPVLLLGLSLAVVVPAEAAAVEDDAVVEEKAQNNILEKIKDDHFQSSSK